MSTEKMIDELDVAAFHARVEARREYQLRAIRNARAERYLTKLEKDAVGVFVDTLLDNLRISDDYEAAVDAAVDYVVESPILLKILTALEAESVVHDGAWESEALTRAADEVIATYQPHWETRNR